MEDTICEKCTRCAKVCGLFSWLRFSGADWLGRQATSHGSNGPEKLKNSIETAWIREPMTDPAGAWTKGRAKVTRVYSGIFAEPLNGSVNTQHYSPSLWVTIVLVYTKPVNSQRQKMNFIWSKLDWKVVTRGRPLCFANQWISNEYPELE